MEDKSIKDFDRAIEQAMNEHAVPPPFGAWNRIAAELDAPVAAAPLVRPFPIAAVGGFVAGALFLGGVVAGVLVYNGNNLNNITYPVASSTVAPVASETTYTAPAVSETANTVVANNNMISAVLPSQQPSKAIAVKAVVADKVSDSKVATLENNNDVAVPQVNVASHASSASTPYYFPPVDITMDEQPVQKNAIPTASTSVNKETATKPISSSTEVKKRSSSSSSSSFRGIKFKKKRSKFTYGRIISTKKH